MFLKNAYLDMRQELEAPFQSEWSVAMFANRESPGVLSQSIRAVLQAITRKSVVDVIVNGNEYLARNIALFAEGFELEKHTHPITLRIWQIEQGDKAHAWNQYLYGIWEGADIAFFADGYVRVHPHALNKIAAAMSSDCHALAATGVPSTGKSAGKLKAQMLAEHGLHGNLHAIRGSTMLDFRKQEFIIPVGIYRTDSLIGAAIKFNLDPSRNRWDPLRIHVIDEASWDHTPLSVLKLSDWFSHFRRLRRQGQGVIENLSIRQHFGIEANLLESLPETAFELTTAWMRTHPREFRKSIARNPLILLSLRGIKQKRDWSRATHPPCLLTKKIYGSWESVVHYSNGIQDLLD